MIMTIDQLRTYITTDESDALLEAKLQAVELLIRQYTNNNFQIRKVRSYADVESNTIHCDATYLSVNDTVQISESQHNEGLYAITALTDTTITVDKDLYAEMDVLVTKVVYPMDVKMGVVNMIKWDLDNRDKVGIQSESISRHSVTYFNMDGDNSTIGFPKSLIGFLKPYMKARF